MSIKVGFEYLTKDSMFAKDDFQDKVNEIHKMSPKMKAIILADVLDKKHF